MMVWSESKLARIMFLAFLGFLIAGVTLVVITVVHPVGYIGFALIFLSGVFFGQYMEVQERLELQRHAGWWPAIRVQAASEDETLSPQDTALQIPQKKDGKE